MSKIDKLVLFYKALADETRLRLISLLIRQRPGEALCVGRLARELGVSSSAVSQHLRMLKDLGLVDKERQGYRVHYYLNHERIAAYGHLVRECLGDAFCKLDSDWGALE